MKIKVPYKLHQPEYTGENRCEPCTILNVVLAVVFSSRMARKSRVVGYAFFPVSIGLIYFRGYLVPGTPTLTKRYLPSEVLRWFGKEPELQTRSGLDGGSHESTNYMSEASTKTSADDSAKTTQDVDLQNYLLAQKVLEPCENRDDLCLVEGFRTEWDDEISKLAERDIDASKAVSVLGLGTRAEEFEVKQYGDAWTLMSGSQMVGQWPSHGALLADVGAARVLSEWSDQWVDLTPAQRGQILNGLRLFLEQCPGGDGSVSMNQETVESCCSSHDVITISCDETGDRLFEQRINEI